MAKKKLGCVLLVDDDEPTNFLHEIVIEESGCTEEIVVVENGRVALDFLTTARNGKYPQPDLIFLDINMPIMGGMEFLEAYNKLEENQLARVIVVMLTTTLENAKIEKIKEVKTNTCFVDKPLLDEKFQKIISSYFSE